MTAVARPNILLITFDGLSEATCADLSHQLPTLSEFRKSSICFSNAYACSPESGPARASLFTGLDMAAHGVWTDGAALPDHETTISERFSNVGYHSWLVGRRQLSGVSNWTTEHARRQEYHHFNWAHGPLHRSRQNAYLTWLQENAPEIHDAVFPGQPDPDNTEPLPAQQQAMAEISDELSFNTWVGSKVCDRLKAAPADRPFLGIAGFVVGETMGAAPKDGPRVEDVNQRALIQADAAIGTILQHLTKSGRFETTTLVITSARGTASSTDLDDILREPAINVPLMIRLPDASAKEEPAIVSTMDIAPTLYEIAQISWPQRTQGHSLVSGKPRGWALSRLRHPGTPHQTVLRTERWKLVMAHGCFGTGALPSYRLYDLRADKFEAHDLAASKAHQEHLEDVIDLMIDGRVALEDRTEPRVAMF